MFQDEFNTVCCIGRAEGSESKHPKSKKQPSKGKKDLAKILKYNSKRKEFEMEEEEELICELSFNGINEDKEANANGPKEGRKRGRPKEKPQIMQIPESRKMNALRYYNTVLDKREKQKKFLTDWGLLDSDVNHMENIIVENDEERDFINSMKIFARFNTPANHVNFMNSLLLEKNIRELLKYLKEARKVGRYDLQELTDKSNKRIFKLLTNKLTTDSTHDSEMLDLDDNDTEINRKRKNRNRKENIMEQLGRNSLKPSLCYGYSLSIPLCKGYEHLNEKERILVEKLGILPESYSVIKKKIIEVKCIEGTIESPQSLNPYYQKLWYSLERYIKMHPEGTKMHQQAPNALGKFLV